MDSYTSHPHLPNRIQIITIQKLQKILAQIPLFTLPLFHSTSTHPKQKSPFSTQRNLPYLNSPRISHLKKISKDLPTRYIYIVENNAQLTA